MMKRVNLIILVISGMLCAFTSCSLGKREKATERLSLPTGEVVINESFLSVGRDSVRHNRLYFQQTASSSRESLGEIIEESAPALSLRAATPSLYRSADRMVLVIGSHVFQRWLRRDGPYWYQVSTNPDPAAAVFLRSFLKPSDPRIAAQRNANVRGWLDIPRPKVPYLFERIDLDNNVLVARRALADTSFPQFLVYSAVKYGFTFRFDIERTREANALTPPPHSHLAIDVSVITYPGEIMSDDARDAALAFPGAKEIDSSTVPLSASTWATTECSFTIPTGTRIEQRFDVLLGFLDPLPDYLSIFWRRHPVLWDDWHFVKMGDWVRVEASGYTGGLAVSVFARVRRIQSNTD